MTGRLAPGAKVDAVMPGLSNSRLPIDPPLPIAPPLWRSICSAVIVVTAENDSSSRSERLPATGVPVSRRAWIGLAVTVVVGSMVPAAPCARRVVAEGDQNQRSSACGQGALAPSRQTGFPSKPPHLTPPRLVML